MIKRFCKSFIINYVFPVLLFNTRCICSLISKIPPKVKVKVKTFDDILQVSSKLAPLYTGCNSNEKTEIFKNFCKCVTIETSSYCNRKCSFCANSYIDRHSEHLFMTDNLYHKILSELAEVEYDGVIFYSFYNEPLAEGEYFINKVKTARKQLPNVVLETHTNGDFVTKEILDKLGRAGLNDMTIMRYFESPDNTSKRKNIQKTHEFVNKLELQTKYIRTTASSYTIECKHPQIEHIKVDMVDFMRVGHNRAGSVKLEKSIREKPNFICQSPFFELNISYNGLVSPCCSVRWEVEKHKGLVVGDINKQSIFDIFSNETMCQLRRSLAYKKVNPICAICMSQMTRAYYPLKSLGF
jgi:MoaA/NifB/PqqE/SkfB family radical SAM enzyme